MRRIKELDAIIYEVYDLSGEALKTAIDSFIDECIEVSGEDTALTLDKEVLIEAMSDNEYFYDKFGNPLSINVGIDSDNEELAYLCLSGGLLVKVNVERI